MKKFSQSELDEMQRKFNEQVRTGQLLFGKGGALAPLFKEFLETALEAEIDAHLDEHERDKGNKRNGRKQKTVCTSDGNVEIEMPQDCQSSFETKVIRKRETILADSLQDRIIGLYGPGMSYRFISSHIHEMYDMEISHTVLIEATGTGRKVGRKIPGVHQFMT